MLVVAVDLEVLFEDLVDAFSLSVSLGVISGGEVRLNAESGTEGRPEFGDKEVATVRDDVSRKAVFREYMSDKVPGEGR